MKTSFLAIAILAIAALGCATTQPPVPTSTPGPAPTVAPTSGTVEASIVDAPPAGLVWLPVPITAGETKSPVYGYPSPERITYVRIQKTLTYLQPLTGGEYRAAGRQLSWPEGKVLRLRVIGDGEVFIRRSDSGLEYAVKP